MMNVRFKCRDGRFREQECIVRSVAECPKIYGLDKCAHVILDVREVL